MMLSGEGGGRLYLEFLSKAGDDGYAGPARERRRASLR